MKQQVLEIKNVYVCMRKNHYSLGGEPSGHTIFGDIERTGDGIMTSLRVMEVIRAERETLSQLCAPVKMYSQVLENVRIDDKEAAMEDEGVVEAIKQASESWLCTGLCQRYRAFDRVLAEAPTKELYNGANAYILRGFENYIFELTIIEYLQN